MELKKQVLSGSSWSLATNVSSQLINFVVMIVLARLLVPEDFGVYAISAVIVGIITLFQELGMGSAIIQKKEINESHLTTSFVISISTNFIIGTLVIAISPLIASFYGKRLLQAVIMVSAIGFFLSPLTSVHNSILTKKLEFKKIGILVVLNQVLSGGTSIVLALTKFGVWSLVLGKIVAQLILIPVYWRTAQWVPKLRFRKDCFKDLFSFSSNLLGFNILNYVSSNSDNLIVMKYLGATTLGYYSIAYNLMIKPLQLISWSISRVLFPAFSAIQSEKERVKEAYLRIIRAISLVTFPMMTGLLVVAREFILGFYGHQWEPAILPLQLLCLLGAIKSITTTGGVLIMSQGKPKLLLKLGLFNTISLVSAFLIGVRWGLIGLILAYIIMSVPNVYIGQYFVNRMIDLKMKFFLKSLIPAFVCSLCMASFLVIFKYILIHFINSNNVIILIVLPAIGFISYSVLIFKFFLSQETLYIYESLISFFKETFFSAKESLKTP